MGGNVLTPEQYKDAVAFAKRYFWLDEAFDSPPHSALADQFWYGLEKLESDAEKDDYVSRMLELTSEHRDAWKAWCLLLLPTLAR